MDTLQEFCGVPPLLRPNVDAVLLAYGVTYVCSMERLSHSICFFNS
jgi:hypothetical protein